MSNRIDLPRRLSTVEHAPQPSCASARRRAWRYDDDLQLRADRLLHAARHRQGQIAVEAPFVELVEHDRGHRCSRTGSSCSIRRNCLRSRPGFASARLMQRSRSGPAIADLAAQRHIRAPNAIRRRRPARPIHATELKHDDRASPFMMLSSTAGSPARSSCPPRSALAEHDGVRFAQRAPTIPCGRTSSMGSGEGIFHSLVGKQVLPLAPARKYVATTGWPSA